MEHAEQNNGHFNGTRINFYWFADIACKNNNYIRFVRVYYLHKKEIMNKEIMHAEHAV